MISETIDHIIGQFEDEVVDYETTAEEFADRQPAILSFLLSEQEGALTDDERGIYVLPGNIWQSVEHMGLNPFKPIDPKKISDAEEANCLMDSWAGLTFKHVELKFSTGRPAGFYRRFFDFLDEVEGL
ncbi:MAG: hypothetical protein R2788_12295 [Saprospiraceae bacterium]